MFQLNLKGIYQGLFTNQFLYYENQLSSTMRKGYKTPETMDSSDSKQTG